MGEEMSKWYCPHPDCADGREYEDPQDIFNTACDKGHEVWLHHQDNKTSIQATLAEPLPAVII
jgi:hypothetical protein